MGQPNWEEIKLQQKNTWGAGNYAVVGSHLMFMSELLCEEVDLHAGQRVLDIATGGGNTALAAARRFCEVTGVDYVPQLLARARLRADAEGLKANFLEADAENLPFPDASFDVVLSTLGVMFAPNQEQAARETLRVCRKGGKIGLTNWTPDGYIGHFFGLLASYAPSSGDLPSPLRWGTEKGLEELLAPEITRLEIRKRSVNFRFLNPQIYVDFYKMYFGPVKQTFAALDASDQQRLEQDLMELVRRFNQADDGTLAWPADYLEVIATK